MPKNRKLTIVVNLRVVFNINSSGVLLSHLQVFFCFLKLKTQIRTGKYDNYTHMLQINPSKLSKINAGYVIPHGLRTTNRLPQARPRKPRENCLPHENASNFQTHVLVRRKKGLIVAHLSIFTSKKLACSRARSFSKPSLKISLKN